MTVGGLVRVTSQYALVRVTIVGCLNETTTLESRAIDSFVATRTLIIANVGYKSDVTLRGREKDSHVTDMWKLGARSGNDTPIIQ